MKVYSIECVKVLNDLLRHFFVCIFFVILALSSHSFASDPISEAMCRDELSFRGCYGFTKEQCLKFADQATNKCINKIPKIRSFNHNDKDNLGKWGILLGHCAEDDFEKEHSSLFKSDEKCSSLLEQRFINRAQDSQLKKDLNPVKVPKVGYEILIIPLILSLLFATLFLRWRTKKKEINFFHGFASWILFLIGGFVGDILSHFILPKLYQDIGDNPAQIAGFITVLMVSFVAVPILYLIFKKNKK